MITNGADWLYVVVNAGCADKDLAHIQEHLARFKASGKEVDLEILSPDYSLVALQGTGALLNRRVIGHVACVRSRLTTWCVCVCVCRVSIGRTRGCGRGG